MSSEQYKVKNSTRRHRDESAVKRQVKIAKAYNHTKYLDEPHRLVKHHAMDCGTPGCILCGNRRHNKALKTKDQLTMQERRMFQDPDHRPDKHSNGLEPEE
jgi:hypothetical protein